MSAFCQICGKELEVSGAGCDHDQDSGDGSASLRLGSPMFDTDPSLQGIGGWLVLVAIALAISPFYLARAVWGDYHVLTLSDRILTPLAMPGLTRVIGLEFFSNAVLLGALVVLIVFFFRQSRLFPRTFQFWLGFSLVAKIAELTLSFRVGGPGWEWDAKYVADMHSRLGNAVLEAAITAVHWISYFEVSQRVKATFVK